VKQTTVVLILVTILAGLPGNPAYSQSEFKESKAPSPQPAFQFAFGLNSRMDVDKAKDMVPWPSFRLYWFQGDHFAWAAGVSHTQQTGINWLDKLKMSAIMIGARAQTVMHQAGAFVEAYFDMRKYDGTYQAWQASDTTYGAGLVIGASYRISRRLATDLSWHAILASRPYVVTTPPDGGLGGGGMILQRDAYNPMSIELHVRMGF
jgi:hypothetical protein